MKHFHIKINKNMLKSKDNIFVTTGSKELKNLTKINDYNRRCVLRVLDVPEIVEECVLTGFDREKIIAERGPFDYRKNYEAFEKAKCKYLITKEFELSIFINSNRYIYYSFFGK